MSLAAECDDALASSLSDLPQRLEWTNRSARAEFFGKFSLSNVRNIIGIDFALWNGPGAIILLAPERTAGMNEQNLEPRAPPLRYARMPALKVDLLEVFFTAAIWLLLAEQSRAGEPSSRHTGPRSPSACPASSAVLCTVTSASRSTHLPGARTYPPGRH